MNLSILILLSQCAFILSQTIDQINIYGISTRLGQLNSNLQGSLMGGTTIYFQASGLDQTASNNIVNIGKYPCLIPDKGVNGIYMNCVTSPVNPNDPSPINLVITITVGSQVSVCTLSNKCQYSFITSFTPYLYSVAPRSVFPRAISSWNAKFTVGSNDVPALEGQFMGGERCDRFSIKDSQSSIINSNSDNVECQVSGNIQAGFYDYKIITQNGVQQNDFNTFQRKVFTDEIYQSKIVPIITSLSTNIVSSQGQILQINGYGFSTDPTSIQISIPGANDPIIVQSATVRQITALIPKLAAPTSQIFLAGTGLKYTRYNFYGTGLNGNCDAFRTQILKNPGQIANMIVEDGFTTEPESLDIYGSYYGQYYRGFFKAPQSGKFRFYVASDDCAQVWIQLTPNSTNQATMTKVAFNGLSPYRNYWQGQIYQTTPQQISSQLDLEKDGLYYIEIYHANSAGVGYLTISFDMEAPTRQQRSLYDLWTISTGYNVVPEVIQYTLYNSVSNSLLKGSYTLLFAYNNYQGTKYSYQTPNLISASASAATIQSQIKSAGYTVTVTSQKLDNTGQILADQTSTTFAGYLYTITFNVYRGATAYQALPKLRNNTLTGGTVVFQTTQITPPSDPISGTFQLAVDTTDSTGTVQTQQFYYLNNSVPVYDLPFNVNPSIIASNFNNIYGTTPLFWSDGNPLTGYNIRLYTRGIDTITNFRVTQNNLKAGSDVTVSIQNTIPQSNNILFEPIPSEVLFRYSSVPQVQLSVGGILAGCGDGVCDYTLSDTKTFTNTTFSSNLNQLSLSLSPGTQSPVLTWDLLTITYGGANCLNIQVTPSGQNYAVTCSLEQQNGVVVSEAGSNVPSVHVNGIGFSLFDASVQGIQQQLTITSVSPNAGSPDGGTTITITGTGFPKDNTRQYSIQIGGNDVTVQSISNTQIVIVTPPKSQSAADSSLTITFNGLTATSNLFSYDDSLQLLIVSLSFNTQSPIFRGNLIITATNVGTDPKALTITLQNNQKTYNLPIISISGNDITVWLRGGMPGDYQVIINRVGYGVSKPQSSASNLFSYGVFVKSVTPSSGSEAGGTVITITGTNIVLSETLVFIGNTVNWYCNIDTAKSTNDQIVCTTPPRSDMTTYSQPVQVIIVTRGSLESTCAQGSTCTFFYDPTLTPVLSYPTGVTPVSGSRLLQETDQSKNRQFYEFKQTRRNLIHQEIKREQVFHFEHFIPSKRRNLLTATDLVLNVYKSYSVGATETVQTTSGFTTTDPINIVFSGYQTASTAGIIDNSGLITYTVPPLVQGDYSTYVQSATGYGNQIWITRIRLTITSFTPLSIPVGGQVITINGQGFSQNLIQSITLGSFKCSNINVVSSQQLQCRIPAIVAATYSILITAQDSNQSGNLIIASSATITVLAQAASPTVSRITTTATLLQATASLTYSGDLSAITITLGGALLDGTTAVTWLETSTQKYQGTVTSKSATAITLAFTNIPVGQYNIQYTIDGKYALFTSSKYQALIVLGQAVTTTLVSSSFAGGQTLTFNGVGFDTTLQNNKIKICGFDCPVQTATFNQITCTAPQLNSAKVFTDYPELQPSYDLLKTSDVVLSADLAGSTQFFDGLQSTYYKSSAATCFIQAQFALNKVFELKSMRFIPRIDSTALLFNGAKFQYSIDGTTFTDLWSIDQTIHSGFNLFVPPATIKGIKIIKFIDSRGATGSLCQIAEIELKGRITFDTGNVQDFVCPADFVINNQALPQIAQSVSYQKAITPQVTNVSPLFASSTGGQTLTITGTGFGSSNGKVTIDNVDCPIQTQLDTQIVCTVGFKDLSTNSVINQFKVSNNGNVASNKVIFKYGNLWSDINTWGGVVFPSDGDSVVVEAGQTLVVDTITPKLVQIISQGSIVFQDGQPTSLDAHYIVVSEGIFQIGTETQPHLSPVSITLRGVWEDVQMPSFGNKVLGCHECTLDIHGKPRNPTWTLLTTTATSGDTTITVDDPIDWQAGEKIVIMSSEVEHTQAEVRTIVSVNNQVITLDQPLLHKHYSAIETYGTQDFPIKTEVGLLTRNIVIQGEASDKNYGYHLMIHGQSNMGAIGRISYSEFTNGGQPVIKGRYPIHYHLNGDVDGSYVRGNSIHDNYGRCVTIHGVSNLLVENNVCYNTFGHAIFLEDGIETNNIIQDNLVGSVKQIWIMLQTDITVATYWITHPTNIVRRNRSGGSEWYGFWYEVKSNPDGPSATSDICPPGLNLIEFSNNYAHSNGRFGLRIFQLFPSTSPCKRPRNDKNVDPFIDNPALNATFSSFKTWKNGQAGILAEKVGQVTFDDIMIADSGVTGFQSHLTNFTQLGATLQNALIVGQSGNADLSVTGFRALIVPRTNGFTAKNIAAYNFPANSVILQSCSQCEFKDIAVVGGKNTNFSNIAIHNSNDANLIEWNNFQREIFWDLDGSITQITGGAYIIPNKVHLTGIPECTPQLNAKYDNSLVCPINQVQVRDVLFNNPSPVGTFEGVPFKFYRLLSSQLQSNLDPALKDADFTIEKGYKIMSGDIDFSYATPFITGHYYHVHLSNGGADFKSISLFASPYFLPTDKGIVLRFNYTTYRETYDVWKNEGGKQTKSYLSIAAIPDPLTCNQGDWYHDLTNKFFYVCLSGKGKSFSEFINIFSITCRLNCAPSVPVTVDPKDVVAKLWSDPATWPSGKLPQAGENVVIDAKYQVILDVNPPPLGNLTVYGQLIFDDNRASSKLEANLIWVYSGSILAGSPEKPFNGNLTIQINGGVSDPVQIIDDFVEPSSKMWAITNNTELYGIVPRTTWTRLVSYASAGTSTIVVDSSLDWNVGDQIVISPSGSDPIQYETRLITSILDNTIKLNAPLLYDHFGAPTETIINSIGVLDMRSSVGHLTRNIKIQAGPDSTNLGFRILVYQFDDTIINLPRRGRAVFSGVEFINGGQINTDNGAVDIQNLNYKPFDQPTVITGCSFHDSQGMFINAQASQNISVTNNVFFNGQRALVQMNNNLYIKFQNNLLVYVTKRIMSGGASNNWAVLANFVYTDNTQQTTDIVEVSDNVGSGSQDTGFFFMATKCSLASAASFHDNECSAAALACFSMRQSDDNCAYVKNTNAYHSLYGVMAVMFTLEIHLDQVILAENRINAVLKLGIHPFYDNKMTFTNSYITTLAIPDCIQCYNSVLKPYCVGAVGLQLGSTSSLAFVPIAEKPSAAQDTICTIQTIDLRVYVDNVIFDGFKLQYPGNDYCRNNAALRQHHSAPDQTGQHFLTNTKATNSDFNALLYNLFSPNTGLLGWFGGCGSFVCTGQINFMVEDQDGQFFGQIGSAIGNNTYFGPNVTYCSRVEPWNGYFCLGNRNSILNFLSTAPDADSRLYSPIKLTDGLFFNEINSFKEWDWNGPEPMNHRNSKFISLITVNTTINMTQAGDNPTSSQYWLTKRSLTGSPSDWVIIKWQFSTPNVIQVSVNGQVIKPGINVQDAHYDLNTMTNICGANNYFYQNRTIHFVVTGATGCIVQVKLAQTLQITSRIAVTSSQFFGSNFLTYAIAQLGGDPYNYFILSVKKSRRFLQSNEFEVNWAVVSPTDIGTNTSTSDANTLFSTITSNLNKLNGTYTVLSSTATPLVISKLNYTSTENTFEVPLTPSTGNTVTNNPGPQNNNSNGSSDTNSTTNNNISTNNSNGQVLAAIRLQSEDNTVTIAVSVVVSVVGLSLLIGFLIWYKKFRMQRMVAHRLQRVDNDFNKVNYSEENLQENRSNIYFILYHFILFIIKGQQELISSFKVIKKWKINNSPMEENEYFYLDIWQLK
ncbi:hypothetical protein pb186bvf_003050 [Paramecium bursaria]